MYPTGPRKKPEEYSTNHNTMRARARKARLDPYTRELEAAQASDSKAITRQLTTVTCQKEYQEASPEVREEMLQQAEKEVMARRGLDTDTKMERFRRLYPDAVPSNTPSTTCSVPDSVQGFSNSVVQGLQRTAQPGTLLQPSAFPPIQQSDMRSASIDSYGNQSMLNEDAHSVLHHGYLVQEHEEYVQVETPVQDHPSPQASCLHDGGQQPSQATDASQTALVASLQATVQSHEDSIQQLAGMIHSLATEILHVKSTSREQATRIASMESQMKIFVESSSDPGAAYFRQAWKLEQVLSGIQSITRAASEVCNSLSINSGGLAEAHGVNPSMATGLGGIRASHRNVESGFHHPEGTFANISPYQHAGMPGTEEMEGMGYTDEQDGKQSTRDMSDEN
ncbi:hypothetical protein E8E14_002282 [Neopestalotiopsis sp. 37M]|nr:hypothetical protein E8E14_002282 [Neopestalotiopsis sp. 37M]